MQYKVSKYNYSMMNEAGELLIYNSYAGTQSLTKVSPKDAIVLREMLHQQRNVNELPASILETLFARGVIVPEDEDEEQKKKLIYLSELAKPALQLTILTTGQCNFRCKYCYESFTEGMMSEEVQQNLLKFVENKIDRYSALTVSWFGGEPLVGMPVIENLSEHFLDICRRHQKPFMANTTTNGYLLDYETEKKLKKYHCTSHQVTIDGIKRTHDAQKPSVDGKGTFDRVIGNLLEIKEKEKSRTVNFTIRVNMTQEIIDCIDEFIDFYGGNFGDDPRFRYLFRPVGDFGGERIHEFGGTLIKSDTLDDAMDVISRKGFGRFPIISDVFLEPGGSVCYAAKLNSFVIMPSGKVMKCTCNLDDCPENEIGFLDERGSMNLDDAKYAAWLGSGETFCGDKGCFFYLSCMGEGCPAKRVLYKGKATCPHEKLRLDTTLKLLDTQNRIFYELEAIEDEH